MEKKHKKLEDRYTPNIRENEKVCIESLILELNEMIHKSWQNQEYYNDYKATMELLIKRGYRLTYKEKDFLMLKDYEIELLALRRCYK